MSDFESNKILGGIGSIMMMIPALNIVGLILLFISMKNFSEYYRDTNIIRNVITSGIFSIIGLSLILLGASLIVGHITFFGAIAGLTLVVVGFICQLLMAMFIKNALYTLANHSGEQLFRTSGTLLWYGALLSIIIVGVLLIWIAYLILAIAFFSLKTNTTTTSYNYTSPSPFQTSATSNAGARFCSYCGAPISPESVFCTRCGKQLNQK